MQRPDKSSDGMLIIEVKWSSGRTSNHGVIGMGVQKNEMEGNTGEPCSRTNRQPRQSYGAIYRRVDVET